MNFLFNLIIKIYVVIIDFIIGVVSALISQENRK